MCSCEPGFTCYRHADEPMEVFLREGDEPSREERERADQYRLWREQQGVLPAGRA